jgi:hypothetical protein
MDQFVDHFKNLISNDNVDNGLDTTDTMECVFEEIVFPSKIYSFKILSTPGDLFRFKPLIQVSISFSVKGLSNSNTRLMKWSEDNSVLTDAQFGFRPGYGTHDAIISPGLVEIWPTDRHI